LQHYGESMATVFARTPNSMSESVSPVLREAAQVLRAGGVVAYPTEAVYGLGCDPFNESALTRLLRIKQRRWQQGLIVIAADVGQLGPFLAPVEDAIWRRVSASWPGPNTWVLPAKEGLSPLLIGEHDSIAVRVTAHPVAAALCRAFGGPIVSTSANLSGQPPARSVFEVRWQLNEAVDCIVEGTVDRQARPSTIRDARSGRVLRG